MHDFHPVIADELVRRGVLRSGLIWHFARPPVIDLGLTRHIDSAGLGALMLIQRRAAERRQTVVLRNPSEEIRFLLVLTKLYDLFLIESGDE